MRTIFILPIAPLLLLGPSDAARTEEATRPATTGASKSADMPSLPDFHPAHGLKPGEFTELFQVLVGQVG